VALDENGDIMSPVEVSSYTQIVRTSSSSATLMELETIQYSSFEGGVSIDVVDGVPGTEFPIGTAQLRVNNLADAKAIAVERGFRKLFIYGNITFANTDNVDDFIVVGQGGALYNTTTVQAGCSTANTVFVTCHLQGVLAGEVEVRDCMIGDLSGFQGKMFNPMLTGTLILAGSGFVELFEPVSAPPVVFGAVIDMGGSGRGLRARRIAGGVTLKNKTGTDQVFLDYISGRLVIDSTCTGGTITVRGITSLVNNAGSGCTVNTDTLVNPGNVSDYVRSELSAEIVQLLEIYKLYGLDPTKPLIVSSTERRAGAEIVQTIEEDEQGVVTVTRQ